MKHKDVCVQLIMKEVEGTKWTFEGSTESSNVRYHKCFGDGDSEAYPTVTNTYCPDMIENFECVGHYQKRLGCRLRKLKKNNKGLETLTEPAIDKLQNYFGIAGGTVAQMATAIWASFLHAGANKHYHDLCEKSATCWCQCRRDQFNKTNLLKHGPCLTNDVIALVKHGPCLTNDVIALVKHGHCLTNDVIALVKHGHCLTNDVIALVKHGPCLTNDVIALVKHGPCLTNDVIALVKPIYMDLNRVEELKKCLHGKTNNQNESYNALIWERGSEWYLSLPRLN